MQLEFFRFEGGEEAVEDAFVAMGAGVVATVDDFGST